MKEETTYKQKSDTRVLCICDGCGKEFLKESRHYKRTRTHYCSRACWCENNKHDNIQNGKISEAKTGKKYPHLSGENHPNWQPDRNRHCVDCGKKFEYRTENQRCRACFMKYNRGENSHSYIDGRTSLIILLRASTAYKNWRHEVFEKDNYTCGECGAKWSKGNPVYIEAHHIKLLIKILTDNNIKSYEDSISCDELWDVMNGLTLCLDCHKEKHREHLKIVV